MRRLTLLLRPHLPDEVFAELVDQVFTSLLPVIVMGLAVAVIAGLVAVTGRDLASWMMAFASLAICGSRTGAMLAYRRQKRRAPLAPEQIRRWEGWYGLGSFAFATLLGLLSARVLVTDDPALAMLVVGMVFAHGSGLVCRVSGRPFICVISLLMVVMPTVVGLVAHFNDPGTHIAVAYMGAAILFIVMAAACLETVGHLYRTMVKQLQTQQDLAALARQDPLTGLPNRLVLRDRLDGAVARMRQTGSIVALHALDLDRFKAVNDSYGHPMGDALLQAVAGRLCNTVPEGDVVARLGGDEFVVVQSGIRTKDEADMLARRIIRVVSAPYSFGALEVRIGVSVGIALAPLNGLGMQRLMACADAALYAAKRGGRSRTMFASEVSALQDVQIAV